MSTFNDNYLNFLYLLIIYKLGYKKQMKMKSWRTKMNTRKMKKKIKTYDYPEDANPNL